MKRQNNHIIYLDDIKKRWEAMEEMSCRPSFSKVKENHIFDEEKSVKWNREQVAINNEKYNTEVNRLNTLKNKTRDAIYEDIYSYIQQEVGHNLSKDKAKAIFNFVHNYSDYEDRFFLLEDTVDLISKVLTPEKEKIQIHRSDENDYEIER